MTKQELNHWTESIKESLMHIADLGYQKRAWMGLVPRVADSATETINTLYDRDFEGYIAYHIQQGSMLAEKMTGLDKMITDYCGMELPDEKILKDQSWQVIAQEADAVVKLLDLY